MASELLLPLAIGQEGVLICNRKIRHRTSVKLESNVDSDAVFPYEYFVS